MKILGIDYGRKKIGLALAEKGVVTPYKVIVGDNLFGKVIKEVKLLSPDKMVVGISEGLMAVESRRFGEKIKTETNTDVSFFDETLSTQDAQEAAISAGIGRKKRREMEDAFAAAIMLQSYLENV